jgi:hypothetical protein
MHQKQQQNLLLQIQLLRPNHQEQTQPIFFAASKSCLVIPAWKARKPIKIKIGSKPKTNVTDLENGIAPTFPRAGPTPMSSTSPIIPAKLAAKTTLTPDNTKKRRMPVQIKPTVTGSSYPMPKIPDASPENNFSKIILISNYFDFFIS